MQCIKDKSYQLGNVSVFKLIKNCVVVVSAVSVWGLSFSAMSASTNDAEKIIDACRAIKNPTKRIECLESATRLAAKAPMQVSPPSPPEKSLEGTARERTQEIKTRWGGASRAATAIKSAIDVGITFQQYLPYIQQLATEVSIAKSKIKYPHENEAADLYQKAIEAYIDVATFWEAHIKFFAGRGNDIAYSGGSPLELTGMSWYANRYNVPTQKADIWGLNRGIPLMVGLSSVWDVAKARVSAAESLLENQPQVLQPTEATKYDTPRYNTKNVGAGNANGVPWLIDDSEGELSPCDSFNSTKWFGCKDLKKY